MPMIANPVAMGDAEFAAGREAGARAERQRIAEMARREAASWETAASISGADHAKTGATALRDFAERIEKGE